MNNNIKKVKEPLFHITRKDNVSFKNKLLVYSIAILVAILLVSIILQITYNYNIFSFIASMFKGGFGTKRKIWLLLHELAILLLLSLAICPPFKMKFWNIGADGQALMGGLCACICMYYFGGKINDGLLIFLELIAALIGGMIWALIPAIFKAIWNTNETLFTLMMNYVAVQAVLFFINLWDKSGHAILNPLPYGNIPIIGNQWLFNILVVAVVTVIITIYLKFTKHGYELALVGESVPTAKYAGLNVKKVIIRTLLLSGLLCGLCGFLLVAGYDHTVSATTINGRGFTAIIVTWMAKFNPLYMVLTAFFVVFINRGSSQLITDLHITTDSFKNIVVGLFFFAIIGCEFFLNYKINFSPKVKEFFNNLFKKKEVVKETTPVKDTEIKEENSK